MLRHSSAISPGHVQGTLPFGLASAFYLYQGLPVAEHGNPYEMPRLPAPIAYRDLAVCLWKSQESFHRLQ